MYDKDFRLIRLINQLIPHSLREALRAFIMSIFVGLEITKQNQYQLHDETNYKLKYNGQIRLLRTQLIDYFGYDFEIIDGVDVGDWTFVYPETTGIALVLTSTSPTILSEAYIAKQKDTFIVKVPSEIYNDTQSFAITKEIINNYKLAGKIAIYQELWTN